MARFDIISKDGSIVRYSGKPRYNGSYLKPSFLEFSEIASPVPISWEVGDYVDYSRTGMRYRLYSIPQPSKNARKDSHGRAFTYSNVQLHAATKELEIALFRDLVSNDNNIHFSTSPDVAIFEDVYGIARRIQACMDDFYPDRWEIRLADFDESEDAEIIEKISEAKDFALSGGTCLDALSKIYELWQDIGWIHTYENGKEVITIGYANKRIADNTSDAYLYGKGNGLTAIKKNQTNKDEFATRLYVYGSERNLPSRHYNGLDILNADSVDVRNLMIPQDKWGKTDGLPDARKAYLENAEAVAKYGLIPKTHYFDSEEAGADIYPSIGEMTVGHLRKVLGDMGQTQYLPSTDIYPDDSERVDKVLSAENPEDDGVINREGKQYDATKSIDISSLDFSISIPANSTAEIVSEKQVAFARFIIDKESGGMVSMKPGMNIIIIGQNIASARAVFKLTDSTYDLWKKASQIKEVEAVSVDGSNWSISMPQMCIKYTNEMRVFEAYLMVKIYITPSSSSERTATAVFPFAQLNINFNRLLSTTFTMTLKQIGFDIEERASVGKGKTISMKSGMCEGRNFAISEVRYNEGTDSWVLTCKRQQDDTLGMYFPNIPYEIKAGDEFVLLDIALPESYIRVAQERLLEEGQKLLARASKIQNHYEPSIDAKVMFESGRSLREGMFMEITDGDVIDNTTEHILIDTLSIYEDESAIPTYKVTLRERRKVTYKGTPSATSTTSTKSVEEDADKEDIDLTGYVKQSELAEMWHLDDNGNLVTDKQVIIKNNLVVYGDQTAGGEGDAVVSITGILIDGVTYGDINSDGLIDLTAAFDNLQASITLDTEMSDESTNGVQNKVIKAYVDRLSLYDIVGEVETPQGNGVLWMVDANGNIIADKHVIVSNGLDVHGNQRISGNLIVEGDISA